MTPFLRFLPVCLVLISACRGPEPADGPKTSDGYVMRDAMIEMRDGVKLYTTIFSPRDQSGPLPFVMLRTPYSADSARGVGMLNRYLEDLAEDGYHFVFQDIRGRYKSEGTFDMMRPALAPGDTTGIDEGTDTWDTIDWLLANVEGHNGRVGMLGISYDGWTTIQGALRPHPALRAISPQASPADMWLGDDFHHNGAFRLSYGFEYAVRMESNKEQANFAFDRYDTYDWYLSLGPLPNADARHLKGAIPTWTDYVEHPDWDAFWQRQTLVPHIRSATVPTLNVAGWWDQEDFYGPFAIYEALERHDSLDHNVVVSGPWNHGGWSGGTGSSLGPISWGDSTATYFRASVQAPFFAYWLKDEGSLDLPEALTFDAGANAWGRWDAWPPTEGVEARSLYFGPDEALSFDPPTVDGSDSYLSDPDHPIPYRPRPIPPTYHPGGSGWSTWLVGDQRFVDDRPDMLAWETPPLEADVTIAGEVMARLYASTTGQDADWIVKLIDVYPEDYEDQKLAGYQLMVSNEVFRGRYRNSFERPEPVRPGAVEEYAFSLHTQHYTFRKGHRIMVQVQSSWFPLIDRNPQTWVPNIFKAEEGDFRAATHTIHRSARYPSRVEVAVVR